LIAGSLGPSIRPLPPTGNNAEELNVRTTILATAVATLVTVAAVIASGATATTSIKTEHFSLINIATSESHTYSAIATGRFTAGGTALVTNGDTAITLRFPSGTIKLAVKPGHLEKTTNPACLLKETSPATYTLVSGTGAYVGISGSGTAVVTATFVGATVAGKCSNDAPATAIQIIDRATGPVSLP
jgi:hypothetical protein